MKCLTCEKTNDYNYAFQCDECMESGKYYETAVDSSSKLDEIDDTELYKYNQNFIEVTRKVITDRFITKFIASHYLEGNRLSWMIDDLRLDYKQRSV